MSAKQPAIKPIIPPESGRDGLIKIVQDHLDAKPPRPKTHKIGGPVKGPESGRYYHLAVYITNATRWEVQRIARDVSDEENRTVSMASVGAAIIEHYLEAVKDEDEV